MSGQNSSKSNQKAPSLLADQSGSQGSSTLAVHGGRGRNPYQSVPEPVVQAATYSFENTADLTSFMEARLWGHADGRTEYGRYGNPTVSAVEKRLAKLDGAEDAILFASGMAAITSVLIAILPTGANLVITDDCYRRTREFCHTFLKRLGITCTVVPMGDYDALEMDHRHLSCAHQCRICCGIYYCSVIRL